VGGNKKIGRNEPCPCGSGKPKDLSDRIICIICLGSLASPKGLAQGK